MQGDEIKILKATDFLPVPQPCPMPHMTHVQRYYLTEVHPGEFRFVNAKYVHFVSDYERTETEKYEQLPEPRKPIPAKTNPSARETRAQPDKRGPVTFDLRGA